MKSGYRLPRTEYLNTETPQKYGGTVLNDLHPYGGGRHKLVDDGHDARRFLSYGGRKRHGAALGRA